jgi:FtsP/CotA-like multicopper oxidase with cupredoxin domain
MFDRRYLKGSLLLGLALSLMGCSSPSLVSIKITPTAEYFGAPGLSAQFTAIGTFQQGNHPATTRDITNEVTWKSNATAVATITNTGVATSGPAIGSTAITATMNGFTGLIIANATAVECTTINTTGTGCQ